MKRHWFYKAWRIRAAPDQQIISLQKKFVDFQFSNGFTEFAVKSVDFVEKAILHIPETLAQPIIYLYFLRAAATGVD